MEKAFCEAQDFTYILINYYDLKSLFVFSGCKGYHVYIWLWNMIQIKQSEEIAMKRIYRLLQEKLLKGLDYETLDPTSVSARAKGVFG